MGPTCAGSCPTTRDTDLLFFAVGGASEHRIQRKVLLDTCFAKIADRSFALDGSTYNRENPFRIPSWIPSVLNVKCETSELMVASSLEMGAGDLLLVIGHIHDDEFKALRNKWSDMPDENVWIMGGTQESFNLKTSIGHAIHGSKCPSYTVEEWTPLWNLYPDSLQKMRSFQWGGFFSSRMPSFIRKDPQSGLTLDAFYRQFNLDQIVEQGKIIEFEKEVLQNAGSDERLNRVLQQIRHIEMDGSGISDTQELLSAVYQAYSDNGPWDDEHVVFSLTRSLMKVIPKFAPLHIKEYDGFVTHMMLRHRSSLKEELDPIDHFRFVETCLRFLQGAGMGEHADYAALLRKGLTGRRVVVLHDLGLDPMSDDWLAVSMLLAVSMEPSKSRVCMQLSCCF